MHPNPRGQKVLSFSVLPLLDAFDLDYLRQLKSLGLTHVHYDVMDEFTGPGTRGFDASRLNDLRLLGFRVNVHFMVNRISAKLVEFVEHPFEGLSFHVEALKDPREGEAYLRYAKNNGRRAGVAFKFDTDFAAYVDLLRLADYVTLMSVVPGKGGQAYNPIVEQNAKDLQQICMDNGIAFPEIEFDGGITAAEIRKLWAVGNKFVSGSWFHKLSAADKRELIRLISTNNLWKPF